MAGRGATRDFVREVGIVFAESLWDRTATCCRSRLYCLVKSAEGKKKESVRRRQKKRKEGKDKPRSAISQSSSSTRRSSKKTSSSGSDNSSSSSSVTESIWSMYARSLAGRPSTASPKRSCCRVEDDIVGYHKRKGGRHGVHSAGTPVLSAPLCINSRQGESQILRADYG